VKYLELFISVDLPLSNEEVKFKESEDL